MTAKSTKTTGMIQSKIESVRNTPRAGYIPPIHITVSCQAPSSHASALIRCQLGTVSLEELKENRFVASCLCLSCPRGSIARHVGRRGRNEQLPAEAPFEQDAFLNRLFQVKIGPPSGIKKGHKIRRTSATPAKGHEGVLHLGRWRGPTRWIEPTNS